MANNTAKDVGHISKFDGSNFPSWKYGVWMLLEKNRLISVVDGSETQPEQEPEVAREKSKVDVNDQKSAKPQPTVIEKIVEQQTENSGMEETMQEPEQIEVDDDPGPNQETDGREANIEDPFFGFHEERRRSTRIAKMKELKRTHECLAGE
ncbi:hypothetical protein DAPPUDRAFT_334291, partial [Daphnia pulex]